MANLLMIDDNQLEHLIMQKMLDKFRLFPDAMYSLDAKVMIDLLGQQDIAEEELPDVIFLDLGIPGFSGWDFLKEFNNLYKRIKKKR